MNYKSYGLGWAATREGRVYEIEGARLLQSRGS
jgi:hypothetical protein